MMKLLSDSQSRLLDLLKEHPFLSVDEIVEKVGGAKTAVRKHLLSMERRGLIERDYRPKERGRPTLIFRLTSDAKRLFPTKEAELFSELMNFMIRKGKEELLEEFFESYWQKRLEEALERIRKKGRDDLDVRLEVLKEVLEEEGFAPSAHISKKDQELLLRQCHCPVEAASHVTSTPCQLEKRFIAKVLNAPLSSLEMKCHAKEPCEFRLPTSKLK